MTRPLTRPRTRPIMVYIERTCPACGASNRIVTPEVRLSWKIGCSRCGTVLVDPEDSRPLPCEVPPHPVRLRRPV